MIANLTTTTIQGDATVFTLDQVIALCTKFDDVLPSYDARAECGPKDEWVIAIHGMGFLVTVTTQEG